MNRRIDPIQEKFDRLKFRFDEEHGCCNRQIKNAYKHNADSAVESAYFQVAVCFIGSAIIIAVYFLYQLIAPYLPLNP